MLIFLAGDALSFIALLAVHLVLREPGTPAVALGTGLGMTAMLAGISGVLVFARMRGGRAAWPYAVVSAIAALFLAAVWSEYGGLRDSRVTITSSVSAAGFYAVTGFHALHVAVGALLTGWLVSLGEEERARSAATVSLYWHFVDVVWIAIFIGVYAA